MKHRYLLRALLKPAGLLVLALVALALVFWQVGLLRSEILDAYARERSQVQALHAQVRELTDQVGIVTDYRDRYDQLAKGGLLGDQSRAVWIDRLMESVYRQGVIKGQIRFSPRVTVQADQVRQLPVDARWVRRESVEFTGNFLHELDVLAFMQDMHQRVHPLSLAQSCRMKALQQGQGVIRTARYLADGHLQVVCQWHFLEAASGSSLPGAGIQE